MEKPKRDVFVIEHDEEIRLALTDLLLAEGYAVHCATTAGEAFERFGQLRPCVTFMNTRLPDDDGYAVAREIIRRRLSGHVFLVGTHPPREGQCPEGADFLAQPYDADRLLEGLASHC